MSGESAEGDIAREQDGAKHPRGQYNYHQWSPYETLLNKCGPAEHGGCMEQQHVRRAVEASTGRPVRAGSSKDDPARPHQASQHDKDR